MHKIIRKSIAYPSWQWERDEEEKENTYVCGVNFGGLTNHMAHIQMRMDADATAAAAGDDGVSYKITLMEKFALFRKDRFINICSV